MILCNYSRQVAKHRASPLAITVCEALTPSPTYTPHGSTSRSSTLAARRISGYQLSSNGLGNFRARTAATGAFFGAQHPSKRTATSAMSAMTNADPLLAAAPPAAAAPSAAPSSAPSAGPAEAPRGMESEAALLSALAEVPAVSRAAARASAGGVVVTATLQQRNLPANAQRRYTVTAALTPGALQGQGGDVTALLGVPQEMSGDVLMTSLSPSGRQQLVVLKGSGEAVSAVLQLWRGGRMAMELHVPKALHGPLVNDGYFASGAAWTADESAVVYTAETPSPERTPAWCGPESLKDAAGPKSWRGVGQAAEDWGELNTGKRPPAPFVLDLARREVVKVPGLPEEHSVGQPAWCPPQPPTTTTNATNATDAATTTTTTCTGGGPSGLVVVAWPHAAPPSFPRLAAAAGPRKLGVVFCYNRSAHLYHVPVTRGADGALQFGGPARRLAAALDSALSPAFTPGGDALVFVSQQEAVDTGTHSATARLYRMDWAPSESASPEGPLTLLVDVVGRPGEGGAGNGPATAAATAPFPGLYTAGLPDDGFVGPSTLLLNTQWGAVSAIAAVDVAPTTAGAARPPPVPLTPVDASAAGAASWSLLAVAGGVAVAARAAPDGPTELHVAQLPADPRSLTAPGAGPLVWRRLALSPGGAREELAPAAQEALDGLEYRVLRVPVADGGHPFDCLVWMPRKRDGPLPAVLAPHGGPHTAVTLGWYPPYAFLAALGYAVLCPNYRGSTGYGQEALGSLPGRVGRQDVADCVAAVRAAADAGLVDPARVSIVGGSHGGFLTGHLLGQHPALFRCGVMRNPVTNIAAMVGLSDIPDWCYVEVLGSEEGRRRCSPLPSPDDLAAFFAASPAAHVDRVTAPVFLMLGAKDRRVPPPDGLQYLGALRGRDAAAAGSPAPPTRLIVFPEDAHGLDKPQTEFEQWVNAAWWIKTYGLAAADTAAEK